MWDYFRGENIVQIFENNSISLSKTFKIVTNSIDSSSRIKLLESSFPFSFGGLSLEVFESMLFICLILFHTFECEPTIVLSSVCY